MRTPVEIDDSPTPEEQAFLSWLDEDFEAHVAIKWENDQWFALLMEFDITGAGATRRAAVEEALELLWAYLVAYHKDGVPFADAVRPIPRRLRARIVVESALARSLRHVTPRLSLARESTYALPPGLIYRFAH